MKETLADWELGGIFSYNSGTPTTVTNTGDPLGLNNGGADPYGPLVRVAGCNPINYTVGGPIVGYPEPELLHGAIGAHVSGFLAALRLQWHPEGGDRRFDWQTHVRSSGAIRTELLHQPPAV